MNLKIIEVFDRKIDFVEVFDFAQEVVEVFERAAIFSISPQPPTPDFFGFFFDDGVDSGLLTYNDGVDSGLLILS
jgi:hypothetical protein